MSHVVLRLMILKKRIFSRSSFRSVVRVAGGVVAGCALLSLSGCAGMAPDDMPAKPRGFSPSVYGVSASKQVVEKGQPVPVGGGVYSVGKPYKVKGKWYHPKHDPKYDETGVASWYGDDFHGRRTSNGEVYNMYALSAAHRTVPVPSYVRVTNPVNGRSIVVRVNDRGPFHENRIIDLSKRTAQVLEITKSGIGRVRVQYVGPATLDGKDGWLETTYQQDGKAMPPTVLAQLAPVPEWARPQYAPPSAVQLALAPVPLARPQVASSSTQVASLAPMVPSSLAPMKPVQAGAASLPQTPIPATAPVVAPKFMPTSLVPLPRPLQVASNTPVAKPSVANVQMATLGGHHVHVGSFRDPAQAMRYRDGLSRHGGALVEPVNVSGITFYQVRLGPFRDMNAANAAMRDAQTQGAVGARISSL